MTNFACKFTLAVALAASMSTFAIAQDTTHHHMATSEMSAPVAVGDLEISGAFTRATLPNAPVAGGFLTITNSGETDDRLVAASADFAQVAQIHEMAMEGDVMKMQQLSEGLVIPAGETVTLEPGGFHVMFMGLTQALVEGEVVPVALVFEHAGEVTVSFEIAGAAADASPMKMDHATH